MKKELIREANKGFSFESTPTRIMSEQRERIILWAGQ